MPYRPSSKRRAPERYDIELLGHRFRASFEQVCHRLTTLRRPGAEGVPFHFVRIDIAGNISKRFSASGIRFARFCGACPRWNVFAAFLTPGHDPHPALADARRHHATSASRARSARTAAATTRRTPCWPIGLGCDVAHARELVYADGVDLENRDAVVPVGVTCRLCERIDCEQRAFPALQHPLQVDENVRGASFYAPTGPR